MPKFRKKPVIIEAVQFTGQNIDEIYALDGWSPITPPKITNDGTLKIATLEGEMTAQKGDWIIRGVKGELYPCKPDIFEETYELED